jgi:hypothetical protein
MDAILATPWPTAAERATLLKNRRLFALKLHDKTRELDKADNEAQRLTRVPEDLPGQETATTAGQRATRARLATALLRLAGLPKKDVEILDKAGNKGAAAKPGAKAWNEFTADLARAWKRLQDEARAEDQLPQAARLSRVLHPANPFRKGALTNATMAIRRQEAAVYWGWLAGRARKQSQALADVPNYQELFRKMALDYAEAAEKN